MQVTLSHRPFGAAGRIAQRRGQLQRVRISPFDEGSRQVRRLVDRDRKQMDLDELEATFAEDAGPAAVSPSSAAEADVSSTSAESVAAVAGDSTRNLTQVNSSAAGASRGLALVCDASRLHAWEEP